MYVKKNNFESHKQADESFLQNGCTLLDITHIYVNYVFLHFLLKYLKRSLTFIKVNHIFKFNYSKCSTLCNIRKICIGL